MGMVQYERNDMGWWWGHPSILTATVRTSAVLSEHLEQISLTPAWIEITRFSVPAQTLKVST